VHGFSLKSDAKSKLESARIPQGRDLLEGPGWIRRVRSCSKCSVKSHAVGAIGEIEALCQGGKPKALRDVERAADPRAKTQKVESFTGIAIDKDAVHSGAGCGALNGSRTGCDVEWQWRVVLQERIERETVAQLLPC